MPLQSRTSTCGDVPHVGSESWQSELISGARQQHHGLTNVFCSRVTISGKVIKQMKIDFNRNALASAIGIVQTVIPTSTPKPILFNVLLELGKDKATVIGTDTEITIRHTVSDVVCCSGDSVLLPARRISEVLRELKEERVTLHVDGKKLQLCGERSKFNIPTEDPADFPSYPEPKDLVEWSLPGNSLKRMIRRTVFATDGKGSRPQFGGVQFETGDKLTVVATDGRRLSMIFSPVECNQPNKTANIAVIPGKALSLVERTVPDSADVVHISFTDSQAVFTTHNAVITCRLIAGRFPRYQDVIPKSHTVSIDLLAGVLHGAIRQSLIFTTMEKCGADFAFSNGNLKLTTYGTEAGDSEVEIPVSYSGGDTIVRVDPRFVSEFLKTVPQESQVNLTASDEYSAVVLSTDDGSLYVTMPIER